MATDVTSPAPAPSHPGTAYLWGASSYDEHPDKWTFLEALLDGNWEAWYLDPGRWVEFRGFWEPPPADAPGTPPPVPAPPRGEWGYMLLSGYRILDPFDDDDQDERVYPQGYLFADTHRAYGGEQVTSGDWSGPGFLFSYQYVDLHFYGQPPS